jgi:mannose-6-phosphate isomerase-like protein (cupin superfamily)
MVVSNVVSRAVFRPDKMGKADLASAGGLFAGLNCFEPGQEHALHAHAGQDKLYYIIQGEGDVTVGGETTRVGPGALVLAKAEEPHAMANPGPGRLVVMVVMAPPPAAKK